MNLAHTSYGTAKGFCQSAFLMMSNPLRLQLRNDTSFILGFHHLIGFAVELYLKAFLVHHEILEAELRKKNYGHKLAALLVASEERGLICGSANSLCSYLRQHESYEYRYMRQEALYELWPLDAIFEMLSELDAYVDQEVGASAAHSRDFGGGWRFPRDAKDWRIS